MRIHAKPVAPITNDPKRESVAAPRPAAAPASPAAVVTLSPAGTSQASQASSAQADGADTSAQSRVKDIKHQIQSGTYSVDLDALAGRIADDEVARGGHT